MWTYTRLRDICSLRCLHVKRLSSYVSGTGAMGWHPLARIPDESSFTNLIITRSKTKVVEPETTDVQNQSITPTKQNISRKPMHPQAHRIHDSSEPLE